MARALAAEIRIEVHGITLREGIREAGNGSEGKAEDPAERLFGPVLLSHVIHCRPHKAADAEQEEQVSSPLNDLSNTIAERLIVAAKDAAARRSLGHSSNSRQRKDSDNSEYWRKGVKYYARLKKPLTRASGTRICEQVLIDLHGVGPIVKPFTKVWSH